MPTSPRISVIGLGYVGLPLAVALARHYSVTGFDTDAGRIADIRAAHDRTGEVAGDVLASSALVCAEDAAALAGSDLFIVTVPTPVDAANTPDFGALREACRIIGGQLVGGAVVVFESTVYPGVTEGVCAAELERASDLVCGRDFFLGYSPERINPGDPEHTLDKIPKVVAGQTAAVTEMLCTVYGAISGGGVYAAPNIRTAEAAKVIENAQRDINIAFINEVTMILRKLDLSIHDVLDVASTKWNFLNFAPGLVGGHCIGVDPYYLAHGAREAGHEPTMVLAGRRINDAMGAYIAAEIAAHLAVSSRVLVLGLTFKENVPDIRNTKVVDLIAELRQRGHRVDVHDPLADPAMVAATYGESLETDLAAIGVYDCLVGAVMHDHYRRFTTADFSTLVTSGGLVADIKGMWRDVELPDGMRRWRL